MPLPSVSIPIHPLAIFSPPSAPLPLVLPCPWHSWRPWHGHPAAATSRRASSVAVDRGGHARRGDGALQRPPRCWNPGNAAPGIVWETPWSFSKEKIYHHTRFSTPSSNATLFSSCVCSSGHIFLLCSSKFCLVWGISFPIFKTCNGSLAYAVLPKVPEHPLPWIS